MTTTITLIERDVIASRPADVPDSHLILNAPRPLYGHKCWQGDFISGVHYAAVDPDGYGAEGYLRENVKLDATLLRFISVEEVRTWVTAFAKSEYPDYDLSEMTETEAWQIYFDCQGARRERRIEI